MRARLAYVLMALAALALVMAAVGVMVLVARHG